MKMEIIKNKEKQISIVSLFNTGVRRNWIFV